jgi:alanine racemase
VSRHAGRYRPTELRVDLAAIAANVAALGRTAGTDVCAVVKGDGYGHGAVPVARAALAGGATWLAVALVEEGEDLRAAGIDAPVLVLSEPPAAAVAALLAARLTPVAYRPAFLEALAAAGAARGVPVGIHLKADTGMGRVGVPEDGWADVVGRAAASPHLDVQGLMTHLAVADEPGNPATDRQLDGFDRFIALAEEHGVRARWIHAANSAGTLLHPRSRRTLVRPGIGVYGLSPDLAVDALDHGLVPASSLVSEVSYAKYVARGTAVSYGLRWSAPADGWVATVPVGYADGVPRRLTGRGEVLVGGRRRPIAGTVTMDQLLVWCGDDRPRVGDEVVLIGRQGAASLRFEDWAEHVGTITYEVATQLTARVPRTHLDPPG